MEFEKKLIMDNDRNKNMTKISQLQEIINDSDNIVFFGGAGVSTESGIPDFRSEKGVFKSLEKYGHSPEYLVSHSYYMDHTEEFFNYYKENLIFKDAKELHGSIHRNYCEFCKREYDLDFILKSDGVPRCECGGIVKPDVVLYEEPLNNDILSSSITYIANADTLIIGGTSLVVYPAAGLINYFNGAKLVLINKSETPYDNLASLVINDAIGETLEQTKIE